jgi:hypothetical protein
MPAERYGRCEKRLASVDIPTQGGQHGYAYHLSIRDTPRQRRAGTRVVRYPIDESTPLLKPAGDGYVHGSEAYRVDVPSMQGATAVGEKFYVSSSRGAATPGSIYTLTKNSGPTEHAGALPPARETSPFGLLETSSGRWPSTQATARSSPSRPPRTDRWLGPLDWALSKGSGRVNLTTPLENARCPRCHRRMPSVPKSFKGL